MPRHTSLLLSILFWGTLTTTLQAQDSATVTRILNPVTIALSDGRTIRLVGVGMKVDRALTIRDIDHYLENLLLDKRVMLLPEDTAHNDATDDHPLSCYVLLDDHLVNIDLVRDGYLVNALGRRHPYGEQFATAQSQAQHNGVGIWADHLARPVRCVGKDQEGNQCREMTTDISRRCFRHRW